MGCLFPGWARTCENVVLGLIRTLMAPNLDPRASPGSFFRAGSPGSHQIQPSCQKWTEILWDLDRNFQIFRIFPKWKTAGFVGWISAWGIQKRDFWHNNISFLRIFFHFRLFGGFPWVPYPIGPRGAGGSGEAFGYSEAFGYPPHLCRGCRAC